MEVFSKFFFYTFLFDCFFHYPLHPITFSPRFRREHGPGGRHLHCEHRVGYSQRGGLEVRRDRSKSAGVQSNSKSEPPFFCFDCFFIIFIIGRPKKESSLQIVCVWIAENLLLPLCAIICCRFLICQISFSTTRWFNRVREWITSSDGSYRVSYETLE